MSFVCKSAAASVALLALGTLVGPVSAGDVVTREDGKTYVNAPTTRVAVDEYTGDTRVRVRAPATKVDVDTERREVRIRVPYFNSDIRW
jgi:hypothetical protein